jgi:hypothetical protein
MAAPLPLTVTSACSKSAVRIGGSEPSAARSISTARRRSAFCRPTISSMTGGDKSFPDAICLAGLAGGMLCSYIPGTT